MKKSILLMKKSLLTAVVASMFILGAQPSVSQAAMITGGTDFSFTSVNAGAIPRPGGGVPANTADGQSANTAYGTAGGGSAFHSPINLPLTFTYTFNQDTDLVNADFLLFNGWGNPLESIKDFTLTFFDSSGSQVGSPFAGVGSPADAIDPTMVSDDEFAIGSYSGVKSFELHVTTTTTGFVEFREVAFENGVIPEPTTAILAAVGLFAGALTRRRSQR